MSEAETTPLPRRLWIALGIAGLAVLLLRPQPTWLPLVEHAAEVQQAGSVLDVADLLIEDAARQPWSAARQQNAGYASLALEDYAAAEAYFRVAVALDGWTPERHRAMGDAYLGLGEQDAALEQWEIAFEAGLDNTGLLQRLARLYEDAGRYDDARTALARLTAAQPANAVAHYRLGVLQALALDDDARAALLSAAAIDPALQPSVDVLLPVIDAMAASGDEAAALTTLGYALVRLQDYGVASAALNEALARDPDQAAAYAYLGLAAEQQGEDGLSYYQQALALAPESALTHTLLGLYWQARDNRERAFAAFETAYALDPLSPTISLELGNLYLADGELVEAETWFTNAARLSPDDAQVWLLLAEFYFENDFKAESAGRAAAEQAARLAPQNAAAQDAAGYGAFLAGDLGEAETRLLLALSLDERRAETLYHLGLVTAEQGRSTEAAAYFEAALALDPDGAIGNAALNALARLEP